MAVVLQHENAQNTQNNSNCDSWCASDASLLLLLRFFVCVSNMQHMLPSTQSSTPFRPPRTTNITAQRSLCHKIFIPVLIKDVFHDMGLRNRGFTDAMLSYKGIGADKIGRHLELVSMKNHNRLLQQCISFLLTGTKQLKLDEQEKLSPESIFGYFLGALGSGTGQCGGPSCAVLCVAVVDGTWMAAGKFQLFSEFR